MSIENQLRDALTSHAGSIESVEANPYERVSAAVGRNRRRRRAAVATTIAAVAALAIGVPAVSSRVADGRTTPAGLPPATDKAWNSVTTWPLRGALAGDGALVDAVQDKFDGRAVFVEDVDTRRVALVVRGDQLIIAAGPRGAEGQALSQNTQVGAPNIRQDSLVSVAAGSALVIITTPDRTSAEVSGTPDIALDGAVTRSWATLPLTGGIGRTALTPLTRFRLGSSVGPVFPLTKEAEKTTLNPCEDGCTGPRATIEARTTADIARTLELDPSRISTTTLFNGEVPREIATAEAPASDTPRPTLLVMHSRLPGGQIVRTAVLRSADAERSMNLSGPIDARRADAVPLLLFVNGTSIKEPALPTAPTKVRIFVAGGTGLRAVLGSTKSAVIPITGHFANFSLPVSPTDFWAHRFEVLERGTSLGTFAVTAPMTDPFEVGP
ncbi:MULTISPECIES: hypothetical protein [unclassified Knoellia]|uniref:hypothetical protein n=1 Tax=Knoellia altitudinis TaxID=3404795 RepID=UPI003614DC80